MNSTIDLYLMNKKGLSVLSYLVEHKITTPIKHIIIGRDCAVENDYSNEIINLSKDNNLCVLERNACFVSAKYGLAVGWRWLIDTSSIRLAVLHDSLLPKYRGFAPLVNMLINQESKIGVSLLWADEGYDTGNIIAQKSINIEYPIKIQTAIDKISSLYAELSLEFIKNIVNGVILEGKAQNNLAATYSLWRNEDDYFINWNDDANKVLRFINALDTPYKGARSYIDNKIVIIKEAEIFDDVVIENRDVGKIIFIVNGDPVIVCGSGLLKITSLIDEQNQNMLPLNKFRIKFNRHR